jgi:hypothetical protein
MLLHAQQTLAVAEVAAATTELFMLVETAVLELL